MKKKRKKTINGIAEELEITPLRLINNCLENYRSGSYLIYRFGREFQMLNEDEKIEFVILMNQQAEVKNRYLASVITLIMANDAEFYEKYQIIIR